MDLHIVDVFVRTAVAEKEVERCERDFERAEDALALARSELTRLRSDSRLIRAPAARGGHVSWHVFRDGLH